MTKYAIIDTETSGLPDYSKPADAEGQPRLAELAMILVDDEDPSTYDEVHFLVRPEGWALGPEMQSINGLTQEVLEERGVPVADVLAAYAAEIDAGRVVVAYNAQYDCKVMRGEMRRIGMDDRFAVTPNICAMRACKGLGIEKAGPKKGGFPKLSDAWRHFHDTELEDAHSAMGDARACLAIFRKLAELGALPAAEVHYTKNRPDAAAA